ncbi:MAG: hypothetical protein H7A23_25980 [Leptospiraceae bacterium]|nr:hypothetical protein [Leptospiraceae bacterium]MCP5498019.1 hypothetical protein [Leptospiraceae bacterium]
MIKNAIHLNYESGKIEKELKVSKNYKFYLWKENAKNAEIYTAYSIKEAMIKLSEEHKNADFRIYAMEIFESLN